MIYLISFALLILLIFLVRNINNGSNINPHYINNATSSTPTNNDLIFAPGMRVLKISLSEYNKTTDNQRNVINRIDGLIAEIFSLYKTDFASLSSAQRCDIAENIVKLCDDLKEEMESATWLEFSNEFDLVEARESAWQLWMCNLSMVLPSDGCVLVAIVDTETTGLLSTDEPITVAILLAEVRMPKGSLARIVESYHGKREPLAPISKEAQRVHGLSLDDVRGHKFDQLRMEQLLRSASIVVAHNAKFDRRMLRHVLSGSDELPWACSMLSLRRYWDERSGRRSLDAICKSLGIDRPLPHNAMTDCEALLKALSMYSGKTPRSKTFLALMLERPWCPDGD